LECRKTHRSRVTADAAAFARAAFALTLSAGLGACDEPRYGKLTPVVEDFEGQIRAKPCASEMTRKLVDVLLQANDPKAALNVCRDYMKQCKWDDEIGEAHYELERSVGDKKNALGLARKLHRSAPENPERLGRYLALLDEGDQKGELLTTLVVQLGLFPQSDTALERLAATYEKQGDPCRALVTWAMLSAASDKHRAHANTERARLSALPACEGTLPTQSTKLSHEVTGGLFVFPASIEVARVQVGVDAVAAYSYFTTEAFAEIPRTKSLKRRLTIRTAFGNREGNMVSIPGITLGGMKIGPFDAVVVPRLEAGQSGMLGQNVLSRLRLDQAGETEWRFRPL
jgi:predicted aspartyl protease